jgi:hypothetical protein
MVQTLNLPVSFHPLQMKRTNPHSCFCRVCYGARLAWSVQWLAAGWMAQGFNGDKRFLSSPNPSLACGPTKLPIQWVSVFFPVGKAARAWCRPPISIWCWVWEWMELYFYSLIVWIGAVLIPITFYLLCYGSRYIGLSRIFQTDAIR